MGLDAHVIECVSDDKGKREAGSTESGGHGKQKGKGEGNVSPVTNHQMDKRKTTIANFASYVVRPTGGERERGKLNSVNYAIKVVANVRDACYERCVRRPSFCWARKKKKKMKTEEEKEKRRRYWKE